MKEKLSFLSESVSGFVREIFRNSRVRIIAEGLAVIVIAGIILSMIISDRNVPTADLKEGVAYIEALENTDTSVVEKAIKEIKKEERKKALEEGDVDVWKQFDDSAILGDSRAVGFSYFGFVDASRVFAEGGATIRDIANYTESLKNLNPSNIFLCFGLNDISIGYWETVEEYITELDGVLDMLHSELPDAAVYVNSTIPATDPAFEQAAKWREIPDWNTVIRQHCLDNGIRYIDISETVAEHADLYDPDGIHMQEAFYDFWAIDMIAEVNEYE